MLYFIIISAMVAYLLYLLQWMLKGTLGRQEMYASFVVHAAVIGTGIIYNKIWVLLLIFAFYSFGMAAMLIHFIFWPGRKEIRGKVIRKAPPDADQSAFTIADDDSKEREFVLNDVYKSVTEGDEIVLIYERTITKKFYLIDVHDADGNSLIENRRRLDRIRRKYRHVYQLFLWISLLIGVLCLIFLLRAMLAGA